MIRQVAFTALYFHYCGRFIGSRVKTLLKRAAEQFVRELARNPVIDHIDHAANRSAAVQQRGGAAQHFNALRQQRLDAGRVIGTNRRSVVAADAVVQHPHPRSALTANDRRADPRPKGLAGNAQLVFQRFTDAAPDFQTQFLIAQNGDRNRGLGDLVLQRRSDNNFF